MIKKVQEIHRKTKKRNSPENLKPAEKTNKSQGKQSLKQ